MCLFPGIYFRINFRKLLDMFCRPYDKSPPILLRKTLNFAPLLVVLIDDYAEFRGIFRRDYWLHLAVF